MPKSTSHDPERIAGILRKAGRKDVFNLGGGLQSWRQAGLPVVK